MVRLGDICEKTANINSDFSGMINYIDISSVDNERKVIVSTQKLDYSEAPSRAKQLVLVGDIIISNVRPNLNAVAMILDEQDNTLVASTGYTVIRCNTTAFNRYVFYFCQYTGFVDSLTSQATGASYPAVNAGIIKNAVIPLPSLEKQHRIAATLDKLQSIITHRKQQLAKLDDLVKARFVEMFGDPVSNPKGWEKRALSDEADIKIGPFGSLLHKEDYVFGGHALVNPSHIVEGKISTDEKLTITDEKYEELSAYHLLPGDVVMGRRGEMGRCAVVEQPGLLCGTGSLLIRSKGDLSADYIQKIISFPSFKRTIEDMAVGQTMPNLNVPIVSGFQIIKPPKSVQDEYYALVAQTDKSKFVRKDQNR